MQIYLVSTIIHKFWKTWQDYTVIALLILLGLLLIFTILFGIFNSAKRDSSIRRTAKRNAKFKQRMEIERQALILLDEKEAQAEYENGEYEVDNEGEAEA